MDVREKLVGLVHNARMNALWHNAQKPDEYITDMLMEDGITVQEWIPVTERLPEEDIRVLVWIGENDRHFPIIDTDRVHKGRWVRWEEYITHWMPLPEPPKGD